MKYLFLAFVFFCFAPTTAFAYLDPGTGSLLLSSVIALIASGVFFFKGVFYKLASLVAGGGGYKLRKKENHSLVFYSEGKQYHNVFKPILAYLDSISYPYTYLTSSKEDFCLYIDSKNTESKELKAILPTNPNAEFEYIGESDSPRAISRLNSLRADVVMMSTPQLDILQIKRSKGVKHYCHIIHSLPHVDIYEIFALDCFDSVFTNSSIHTDFIRETEKVRGLKEKEIVITGCTYLDILQEKLHAYQALENEKKIHFFPQKEKKTTILIAPSWGREALLSKYGMRLIKPFMESQFNVIIRPHPQSYVSQIELLDSLKEQTKECKNIVWDSNRDNIYALDSADIMIGDFSGVLFDFVCLFEKPVVTPTFTFNIIGYDLEDIYDTPWVKNALTKIGKNIEPSEFDNLPKIIETLFEKDEYSALQESIKEMKKLLWEYQGIGGIKSAQEILRIQKEILESRLKDKLGLHHKINTIKKALEKSAHILGEDLREDSKKDFSEDSANLDSRKTLESAKESAKNLESIKEKL